MMHADRGLVLSDGEAFAPFVPPITIELTSRCNLKCPYCANPTLKRDYAEMDDALLDRLIAECAADKLSVMAVHGIGEPLLRKDLEQVLARFSSAGIWQGWMCTNGTLLTAARAQRLVQAGLKGLYVSVDTLQADLYSRTRGGKLVKVIGNIRQVAAALPNLPIVVGLMNHKEQTIGAALLDEFYTHFADLPNVHHHAYENMRFPQSAQDWRRTDPKTGRKTEYDTCDQWAYHFTIAIDGRVSLCCVDQEVEHEIGNVRERSIRDIWLDAKTQATFRSIALGLSDCPAVCTKCVLRPSRLMLADVDPLLAAPYRVVEFEAASAEMSGDAQLALKLVTAMLERSPWDQQLKARAARLRGSADPTIFETARAERAKRSPPKLEKAS